jgi:hypothetical protein
MSWAKDEKSGGVYREKVDELGLVGEGKRGKS